MRFRSPDARETDTEPNLDQVVQLLHHATDVDFTHYKFNTLSRRITRRMVLQKMDGLSDYVQFLRQTPAEVDALYQDILISVTSFFRDPESFEALKSKVFSRLLKDRSRHDPMRIWTLGCSTGQEAYSWPWRSRNAPRPRAPPCALQLFATDLNPAGIEKARAGVYPKDIDQDVSPERLRRFFTEADGRYRISKTIRDACVFSRHNVLADPPFSRIDLISCRNLLIYLEPVLQQKIVPTLHYALKPTGFLWLGGSETIGTYRNLFETEDAKHKIYAQETWLRPGARPLPAATRRRATDPVHADHWRGRSDGDGPAPGGGPHTLDQVRPARRARLRRPGHPAIPRGHRPVSGTGPGQGQSEPAEDAPRRIARRRSRGRPPGRQGGDAGAGGGLARQIERRLPRGRHRSDSD